MPLKPQRLELTWTDKDVRPLLEPRILLENTSFLDSAKDNLIVEITPKETSTAGNQVQIPLEAANGFLGDFTVEGDSKTVILRNGSTNLGGDRSMKLYDNSTVRLTISDLALQDRPCVVVFHKCDQNTFTYEIVKKTTHLKDYTFLFDLCTNQTNSNSRWWGFINKEEI